MEGEQRKLLGMPFCFAGMGIFRAWTETVYANTSIVFPIQANAFADFHHARRRCAWRKQDCTSVRQVMAGSRCCHLPHRVNML